MIKNDGMQINNNIQMTNKEKIDRDIDELTFNLWKSELQKGLPNFWEIMNKF